MTALATPLRNALIAAKLIAREEAVDAMPLAGGVSSDIWVVETRSGPVCVKRALARLRVDQHWEAPVERSQYEAEWIRQAAAITPLNVPELIAHDPATGVLIMSYFAPEAYSDWRTQLRDADVSLLTVSRIARALGQIHSDSAARPYLSQTFSNHAIFEALRISPYLRATAERNPQCERAIVELITSLAAHRKAMIHGDFSPKNILVGDDRIIILDAECAVWGDPCFDVAFCLNHLLLKSMWNRSAAGRLKAAFKLFYDTYRPFVSWEADDMVERRTAALLPALLLARIDGKSPVEYITQPESKSFVREFACACLVDPVASLNEISDRWFDALNAFTSEASPS